jgi:hypothetical protein
MGPDSDGYYIHISVIIYLLLTTNTRTTAKLEHRDAIVYESLLKHSLHFDRQVNLETSLIKRP